MERDCHADDRLMYSPYYSHNIRAARIKERCVDNAVDGQRWYARALGAKQIGRTGRSTSDGIRGRCAGGISVKSRETDQENGYENRLPVLSYEQSPNAGSQIQAGGSRSKIVQIKARGIYLRFYGNLIFSVHLKQSQY